MTIFVEKTLIQLNNQALGDVNSHSKLNYTAVISNDHDIGQVHLFDEAGQVPGSPWKCSSEPLKIVWHPSQATIIVGCGSGEVFSLSLDSLNLREVSLPTTHKLPIKFVKWANDSQLLSLSSTGILDVWNFSKDGHYQHVSETSVKDGPCEMVVLTSHAAPWECYIGCSSGLIYQTVQDTSGFREVFNMDKAIHEIVSYEDSLCVLTLGGVLSILRRNRMAKTASEILQPLNTVKMSGKSRSIQLAWLGKDLLALSGGDLTIRLWNCQSNDTYILPLPDIAESFHSGAEHFTTLAYRQPLLAAATNLGGIAFWRCSSSASLSKSNSNPEDEWRFIGLVGLPGGSMNYSTWGSNRYLYVHTGNRLYRIVQQEPSISFKNDVGVVQLSSSVASVHKGKLSVNVDLPLKMVGVDLYGNNFAVWGDGKVAIYQMGVALTTEKPPVIGTFDCVCSSLRLHQSACFCLENMVIQMRSFQGSLLATLSFMESEGSPVNLELSGHFLCSASSAGYVKLWDVSNRDPKLHVSTKNVVTNISGFLRFRSFKSNNDGTCVSFIVEADEGSNCRLYLWRTVWNTIESFDVATESSLNVDRMTLGPHFWDEEEPRIVLCQLSSLQEKSWIVSLFVPTEQQEMLVQDVVPVTADGGGPIEAVLIGVRLPHFSILDESARIHSRILSSLSSLSEHSDKAARDALLSFSCHLRRGKVEQAYQVVRSFASPKIWESLARSCVQLKRPDVGLICLGKLGNARSAAAVRTAQTKYAGQIEAVTAVLAVQLGMIDVAEELCEESSCYDLLNRMYQASNRWEEALQLAHTKDRINLKRTYYDYARHLEGEGKIALAREMYEKCQTHHFDVPRMLLEDIGTLQEYCTTGQDPDRLKWWAQFLESSGEMEAAIEHYGRAGDYLSLVRLHCYMGDLERATELAESSQDRAACFHVARQHEATNNVTEALRFFGQASAYGNAVRLCKEHELDDQLYRYALLGDQEEMIEAARYFESPPASDSGSDRQPRFDRAVMLYSKAGLLDTALDLASRTEQHEAILELARRLDRTSNPASLQRCADYLAAHQHYNAAVDLLAMAGKYSEAIEMCLKFDVKLTETLSDQLAKAGETNSRLLIQLAEAAQRQGDYQLAAKKFTQAGEKDLAMKALLKSGDTERIIFFANVSRQANIYVLAGNYLQTLDWRSHPEYVKNIVAFYTKAKALELLAGFYDACAQTEVDEYQNYESALNALTEAFKILSKTSGPNQSVKSKEISTKIESLEKFISLRLAAAASPQGISQFENLLRSPFMGIIKPKNVYSALFQIQFDHQMDSEALQTLNMMRSSVPNFVDYLNRDTIIRLCNKCNIPPDVYLRQEENDGDDNPEEIREIIRR